MKPIRLEDLVPEASSFTLRSTGKTYHLRAVTLADEIWLNKTFGNEIEAIFKEVRMKEICRIVFHQLREEDKREFKAKEVSFINEEGEENTVRIGGAELLYIQVSGHMEKVQIFEAMLQTIGVSRPLIEKMSDENKSDSTEKKTQTEPTGQ